MYTLSHLLTASRPLNVISFSSPNPSPIIYSILLSLLRRPTKKEKQCTISKYNIHLNSNGRKQTEWNTGIFQAFPLKYPQNISRKKRLFHWNSWNLEKSTSQPNTQLNRRRKKASSSCISIYLVDPKQTQDSTFSVIWSKTQILNGSKHLRMQI